MLAARMGRVKLIPSRLIEHPLSDLDPEVTLILSLT